MPKCNAHLKSWSILLVPACTSFHKIEIDVDPFPSWSLLLEWWKLDLNYSISKILWIITTGLKKSQLDSTVPDYPFKWYINKLSWTSWGLFGNYFRKIGQMMENVLLIPPSHLSIFPLPKALDIYVYCRTRTFRVCLYIAYLASGAASLYIKTLYFCLFFSHWWGWRQFSF